MYGLCFQASAFMFILILNIIYFSKKRIKTEETKTFGIILIVNLIGVIVDIISTSMSLFGIQNFILTFVSKLYLVYLVAISILFIFYTIYISYDVKNTYKLKMLLFIIFILLAIACILTPLYNYSENGIVYTYGLSVDILKVEGFTSYVIIIIIILSKFKKIKNKKYIPLLGLVLFGLTASLLQTMYPEILIMTFAMILVAFIMYFTIENPDIQLLNTAEMAKDKAEKANAAKTDFLSSMSHEIRTPLNAIVGFSHAIQDEETLQGAKEDAKNIIMASDNLLELVNGILDISKIEANKMEIVKVDYNLKNEVETLIKLIKPRIGEKPIELNLSVAPDLPECLYGDKAKIKEIITNLLTNAVKYTDKGHIDVIVSCINKNNESSLIISVEDTGRGIKPNKIDKLFDKFERLDEDRNTTIEGSGLGLAITKKLVEMMEGRLVVQSVYGSGSKFTFSVKQIISNKKITSELTPINDLFLEDKKVLLVDDNVLNLKIAEKILKKYNITTESCDSGFACIDKVKSGAYYDLILLDDMMPKMSGTETLHILKENPKFTTKVVVLTANAIEGMKDKYIDAGFDDYLAKPIEKLELERVIRRFLNNEEESVNFEPLPVDLYDISDSVIERINNETPEDVTVEEIVN